MKKYKIVTEYNYCERRHVVYQRYCWLFWEQISFGLNDLKRAEELVEFLETPTIYR